MRLYISRGYPEINSIQHDEKPTATYKNRSRDAHVYFCIAKVKDALNIGGVRHLIFRVRHYSQSSRLNQFQITALFALFLAGVSPQA